MTRGNSLLAFLLESWKRTTGDSRRGFQTKSESYIRVYYMNHETCQTSTRHIHDLPDEILYNIFSKGCEPTPDVTFFPKSSGLQLRGFPKLARRVCTRWRLLIDEQSQANLKELWVTNLLLIYDNESGETHQSTSAFHSNLRDLRAKLKRSSNKTSIELFLRCMTHVNEQRLACFLEGKSLEV